VPLHGKKREIFEIVFLIDHIAEFGVQGVNFVFHDSSSCFSSRPKNKKSLASFSGLSKIFFTSKSSTDY
jgi:hypothetical protein